MALSEILKERREQILERWRQAVFATYPGDSVGFLTKKSDPFENPVGAATGRSLAALYDALAGGESVRALEPAMDEIVRVRAVQDFTPAQAVGFVFLVKGAVREAVGEPGFEAKGAAELLDFERRVDELALVAFDVYAKCKADLAAIRARDLQRRTYRLVEMAQHISAKDRDNTDHLGQKGRDA